MHDKVSAKGPPGTNDTNVYQLWLKLAALPLVIAALGLPINDLFRYAILVFAAVLIFAGAISPRLRPWMGAAAAVALCVPGQFILAAPRIEEGHNAFIVDAPGGALEAGLPTDAFSFMRAEFDARYPPERRCDPPNDGCWLRQGFPDRPFAFSADGIFDRPALSRRVTGVDLPTRSGFASGSSMSCATTGIRTPATSTAPRATAASGCSCTAGGSRCPGSSCTGSRPRSPAARCVGAATSCGKAPVAISIRSTIARWRARR